MLIGWGTPFNNRSAIGKFSRAVCRELNARGHEIVILRLETGPELNIEPLESNFSIHSASYFDLAKLDLLVVNFGNHAPYHAQSIPLLAKSAPVGIFHDAEMRDFEWGLRNRHRIDLGKIHGIENEELEFEDDLVAQMARPVLATLAAMCRSAVVHGGHYRSVVNQYCAGPVVTIPLCFPDHGGPRQEMALGDGHRVIIFGVINEYKQPRRVMRALALLKERLGPISLHLAGAIEDNYRAKLVEESHALAIPEPIFHGYVPDSELQALIDNSHAVCCLRFPVTEGGSASLATALYSERPLIVADVASYADVPDDLAFKVSYGNQAEDVAEAIWTILHNPERADSTAARAKLWAVTRYSAEAYVDALLPLIETPDPACTLADIARTICPSITHPDGKMDSGVLPEVAQVLEWMVNAQMRSID